jgi:hypothetical protein
MALESGLTFVAALDGIFLNKNYIVQYPQK